MLYLYLISEVGHGGYDTYDSAVVVASTAAKAKLIHPDGDGRALDGDDWPSWPRNVEDITATRIGTAGPKLKAGEVVCASYNAG